MKILEKSYASYAAPALASCLTSDKCLVCRRSTASGAKRSNECSDSSSKFVITGSSCNLYSGIEQGIKCTASRAYCHKLLGIFEFQASHLVYELGASSRELKICVFDQPSASWSLVFVSIIGCLVLLQGIRSTGMLLRSEVA